LLRESLIIEDVDSEMEKTSEKHNIMEWKYNGNEESVIACNIKESEET